VSATPSSSEEFFVRLRGVVVRGEFIATGLDVLTGRSLEIVDAVRRAVEKTLRSA
jgi:hypothetical protein